MKLHNFAGLMLCCGVFAALSLLNPWYAVGFVAAFVGGVLLAFIFANAVVHSTRRGWYKRP